MNRLPLCVFTLALDASPWIACIYSELMRLRDVTWRWVIVEGAAMPVADTKWIEKQEPRLSRDGTTEFLNALAHHPRIKIIRSTRWDGKAAMCQAATDNFHEAAVLIQNDADEIWSTDQYRRIVELFEDDPALMTARFHCDYMLGPNVRTTDKGKDNEWLRAWRFTPGSKWISHEPPNLSGSDGKSLTRAETAALGLVFQHHAWTLPKHVAMKEALYGPRFAGAMDGWKKLQANTEWPLRDAGRFLPAAFRGTPADRLF